VRHAEPNDLRHEEKPDPNTQRLILVDGHAYAYRAFHAIRNLHGPDGRPTNAIFGFIKALQKLQAAGQPSHWAVAWDGGLSQERLAKLPEYKANRPPMPTELVLQIIGMQEYLTASNIVWFQEPGLEADDLIAALAQAACRKGGIRTLVASPDKDFMQLVSEQVGIINPGTAEPVVWYPEHVRNKAGVDPAQIVDWLSLVGDKVDNIWGVPGVGPVNASKLLNKFGSIENMFKRLDEIEPASLRDRVQASRELLLRNQELIRLKPDVKTGFDWDKLKVRAPELERVRELYAGWGFKGMLAALDAPPSQQIELTLDA
jgi:DNA polymerase I